MRQRSGPEAPVPADAMGSAGSAPMRQRRHRPLPVDASSSRGRAVSAPHFEAVAIEPGREVAGFVAEQGRRLDAPD